MSKTQTIASVVAVACATAAIAVFWSPAARSQINAAPSWVPIGVSQSGNASTAWFHEPSSRQVVACQTSGQAPNGIHCVTVKLP